MEHKKKIKDLFGNDETKKLVRYVFKPFLFTFVIVSLLIFFICIILLVFGKFNEVLVSWDLKYNSSMILILRNIFLVVLIAALGYGIFLSLHKYRRPGGKGIKTVSYPKGSTYQALHIIPEPEKKEEQMNDKA